MKKYNIKELEAKLETCKDIDLYEKIGWFFVSDVDTFSKDLMVQRL